MNQYIRAVQYVCVYSYVSMHVCMYVCMCVICKTYINITKVQMHCFYKNDNVLHAMCVCVYVCMLQCMFHIMFIMQSVLCMYALDIKIHRVGEKFYNV